MQCRCCNRTTSSILEWSSAFRPERVRDQNMPNYSAHHVQEHRDFRVVRCLTSLLKDVGCANVSALQTVIECDHTYMRPHCGVRQNSCLVQNGAVPTYSLPIKYASLRPSFQSRTHTFPRPFKFHCSWRNLLISSLHSIQSIRLRDTSLTPLVPHGRQ
jgi:hypothetical protein